MRNECYERNLRELFERYTEERRVANSEEARVEARVRLNWRLAGLADAYNAPNSMKPDRPGPSYVGMTYF